MTEILMPRLSDSMEEGTIAGWLKADGEEVSAGDEIVEIETDKTTMPFESDASGKLAILAADGETLPVGTVIATVGGESSSGAAAGPPSEKNAAISEDGRGPAREPTPSGPAHDSLAPVADGSARRVSASPIARRVAERLGVDLGQVPGSGPYGRILKRDVVAWTETPPSQDVGLAPSTPAAVAAAPTTPAPNAAEPGLVSEIVPLSRIEQIVAERMTLSKSTVPDFSLEADVNMTGLLELREELRGLLDPVPSINDLIIKAVGRCLQEHPRVNSTFRGDHIEQFGRINVGMAAATEQGLVVPTIRDADITPLGAIAATSRALVEKARSGSLTPAELDGGTITVSNLGMLGVDRFSGVINPPQAAIVCVGRTTRRYTEGANGEPVAAPVLTITMVCDHRVLDGAQGARFLSDLQDLMEAPMKMLV